MYDSINFDNMNHFEELDTFLFFIGYPRSGHTLIGSLLDAHPEMVIAHELKAFAELEKGIQPAKIFSKLFETHLSLQKVDMIGWDTIIKFQNNGKANIKA